MDSKEAFCVLLAIVFLSSCTVSETDPRDAEALHSLYASLNFPPLTGWTPDGGDPCGEQWQGVLCVYSNVTSLILNDANLGGTLGDSLAFPSILQIDLRNNHIGGTIPPFLPPTLLNLSLESNDLVGNIPDVFQQLVSLQELDLSGNQLTGDLPPSIGNMLSLNALDLSENNMNGPLPSSMASMLSLNSLYLEGNNFTGVLDVLQGLPLQNLNIENNEFSGPVPGPLLSIPNFRNDGNPFNNTVLPSIPPLSPSSALSPSDRSPETNTTQGSWVPIASPRQNHSSGRKIALVIVLVVIAVAIALGLCIYIPFFVKRRLARQDLETAHPWKPKNPKINKDKGGKDISQTGIATEKINLPARSKTPSQSNSNHNPSLKPFTIAALQQYTKSFSDDSLLGEGMIGSVYKAELPNGMLLAVKNLKSSPSLQNPEDFSNLITGISKIRHPNILSIIGFCNEEHHRLLVYEFSKTGSLRDFLQSDEETRKKLTWNARIKIALGAAKVLQYLHEGCDPPVVHGNLRSGNVLLDEKLQPLVSECGLQTLIPSYGKDVPVHGSGADGCFPPESEYTARSDIYSFGVVMLELLTGKKPYDRSRSRGAQSLVRWAVPRLHDIESLSRIVDVPLKGAFPLKSLSRYADVISTCIQWEPEFRPRASELVHDLLQLS